MNASRQQRKEPVRFTSRISAHTSGVISANGTDFNAPAAQTRAERLPIPSTSANRRSTSPALLTSVGAGVASPPLSRMRAAISSRASRSRAASTTCAPAAAMASAVAAPIPRLAPVTTANRPESQCLDSTMDRGSGTSAGSGSTGSGVQTLSRFGPRTQLLNGGENPDLLRVRLGSGSHGPMASRNAILVAPGRTIQAIV
jgi:hypothetical protein